MQQAWIGGKPAALEAAIAEAAKLLGASRNPLIAGLGTDIAGARAAIGLADRIGAVIDHMNSPALLRNLEVVRSYGFMLTTPTEARARADTLLLIGPGIAEALPASAQELLGSKTAAGAERRIFWLCPGTDLARAHESIAPVGKDPKDLPTLTASLRAAMAGRPAGRARVPAKLLEKVAAALNAARFGLALWSAAALDDLTIEMICGLVSDLNAKTRFTALPLDPGDNVIGVMHACGWMTGFPMRTAFGRGYPEHDPWLFDGRRLVASGETDCVLWISAYRAEAPAWPKAPVTIALAGQGARFQAPPRVQIEVGRPGFDHAAVEYQASTGTLGLVEARQPSAAIPAAEVISRITSALPEGKRPC